MNDLKTDSIPGSGHPLGLPEMKTVADVVRDGEIDAEGHVRSFAKARIASEIGQDVDSIDWDNIVLKGRPFPGT